MPYLTPLVNVATGKLGVYSVQEDRVTEKQLRLGRLSWSELGHQKWTHESPLTRRKSKTWSFIDTEIWAPNRAACERDDKWPDFFLHIVRPIEIHQTQAVHLALNESLYLQHEPRIKALLSFLSRATQSVLVAHSRSPWMRENDYIDSFLTIGFYYREAQRDKIPDLAKMKGNWTRYEIT